MRPALARRAVLTALAEVRLICLDGTVLTETIGSATLSRLCSIKGSGSTVELSLVLQRRDDLDYGAISACADARIEELDCLSGRISSLRRCSSAHLTTIVRLHVGAVGHKTLVASSDCVPPSVLNEALCRNPTNRLLGIRDLCLASLEQRINFLLALGASSQCAPHLDETMCGTPPGEPLLCPIEELGTMGLDEPCCATGCEPCVWESYYLQQSRQRASRNEQSTLKRPRAADAALNVTAAPQSGPSVEAVDVACPRLTAERMQAVRLVERHACGGNVLLLVFSAALQRPPDVPYHVKLRVAAEDGAPVTRAYTVLRYAAQQLELLVRVQPGGRCSQALANLPIGRCVDLRGPICTDDALRRVIDECRDDPHQLGGSGPACDSLLGVPTVPMRLDCLSAGSGIAPMYQIADAVVTRAERECAKMADGASPEVTAHVHVWSVHRCIGDVLLARDIAVLQLRGRRVGVVLHCTYVLTREAPKGSDVPDPCATHGGIATLRFGRPSLAHLAGTVSAGDHAVATLVVCGPESFNHSMEEAALAHGYARERVFVRETPNGDA